MQHDIKQTAVADIRASVREHSVVPRDLNDLDELIRRIGDAKYVLLGEASHGTHEYYTWRAQISKRLIEEKGFSFIAVEGDWPDCYNLNRFVKGYPDSGHNAWEVLHTFRRWPTWMWANWEIAAFAEWMRQHNRESVPEKKVGFYGLDVYSLWESFDAIIRYLDQKDPGAKQKVIDALRCFEPYGDGEGQAYARASLMVPELCEEEVISLLKEMREHVKEFPSDPESAMSLEQNAEIIVHAEQYYRAMVRPGAGSWNIRDRHMCDTLERLMKLHGPDAKAIVWEHNTHIGDARFTDMRDEGMINVGQVLNEQFGKDVFSIGFGSYEGTVIAGSEWGDRMQVMQVPRAIPGSWEELLHQLGDDQRIIFNRELREEWKEEVFVHRAIGVVYHPDYEYAGNYVPSFIARRYDAFIYLARTSALHPLHIAPHGHEIPDTFPFGI